MSGRKKKSQSKGQRKDEPGLAFSKLNFEGIDHEAFKKAVLKHAEEKVSKLPQILEEVGTRLRKWNPSVVLASFAAYALQVLVGKEGEGAEALDGELQQHHGEVLQAICLSIEFADWGILPPPPLETQAILDALPDIADSSLYSRLLVTRDETDREAMAVGSLQERIRLHTQAVRNWAYYSDVVRVSRDLYQALDADFRIAHGFAASSIVAVGDALIKTMEERGKKRIEKLRRVYRGKTLRQVVRLYYETYDDLTGTAEELLAALPPGTTREGILGMILAHTDLRLPDMMTFEPREIAEATRLAEDEILRVFEAISLSPGDLATHDPKHLFLNNPVWTAPVIDLGERFFVPMPQIIFSHIHAIMRRFAALGNLTEKLDRRRSKYLEETTESLLKRALPGAKVIAGQTWKVGAEQFESDVLVVIDRILVIAEAKSHHLTPEGLRGAPDRMKRHMKNLIVEPSIQSDRLQKIVHDARNGDQGAIAAANKLGFDPADIQHVIRVSVTLDDFSVLSASELELKSAGWIPQDMVLAPTFTVSDLEYVIDVLERPSLILHYISERGHFQTSFELLGDELDFLGVYLDSGFNLAALAEDQPRLGITGASAPMDRYYNSRDAGIQIRKPRPKLSHYLDKLIGKLEENRPKGWTLIALHLLNSADPKEQKKVSRALEKLRGDVKKNFRKPGHVNSLHLLPPLQRKAPVIFYVRPDSASESTQRVLEHYAVETLEETKRRECVVIAKSTERWAEPYVAIGLIASTSH
jgi:hypothetical protein